MIAEQLYASTVGPNWEMIAIGCVTLIVSIIGAYATGIGRRVAVLEHNTSELKLLIYQEFMNKTEADRMRMELKSSLDALHSRLDRAGFPHNQGN
jgi:hypothetical protein